jgi:hypothetical protein
MKTFNPLSVLACTAFVMFLGAGPVAAQQGQGRGNFEEFRQRMMDNYRERLEIKSDDEWKAIQPLIVKVTDARREVGFGGGFGFGRGGGRRGGGGGNEAQSNGNNQGGGRRAGGGAFGEPSPEAEELQKAIDSNASKEELKAKLAKYREAHKEKEAKLAKAQEDLKKVLTVKQEANAVLMGLLQ